MENAEGEYKYKGIYSGYVILAPVSLLRIGVDKSLGEWRNFGAGDPDFALPIEQGFYISPASSSNPEKTHRNYTCGDTTKRRAHE